MLLLVDVAWMLMWIGLVCVDIQWLDVGVEGVCGCVSVWRGSVCVVV